MIENKLINKTNSTGFFGVINFNRVCNSVTDLLIK